MTPASSSCVDWLLGRYAEAGNRRIFGVPGSGSSRDLIDAARRLDMELVLTASEDAAVIMAGVLGVIQGAPRIAFTTKGPFITRISATCQHRSPEERTRQTSSRPL